MTTTGRSTPAAFTISRALIAAALAAAAPAAGAHEFTCERTAGILAVGGTGAPVLGADGLPLFAAPPSPVLTLTSYPALVGLRVDLRNAASETSVVTGVTDTLLAAIGGSAQTFGAAIGPGFSLPVGASGTRITTVAVASQQACLSLFGGVPADAPVCANVAEARFAVEHDAGSSECRARVVCAAPAGPPPQGCGDAWHGVKQFGTGWGSRISLDGACGVVVAGADGSRAGFLARLDASGARTQVVAFDDGSRPPTVAGLAVDAAGNRWVAWSRPLYSVFEAAHAGRFAADGTQTLDYVVNPAPTGNPGDPPPFAHASSVAVDADGDAYLVGGVAFHAPLPGFTISGGFGAFAVKIDAATGIPAWAIQFGDPASVGGAVVDATGALLIVGSTAGTIPGNVSAGGNDAFVARIAPDGTVQRIVQFGSARSEEARGVAIDAAGDVYVSGVTLDPAQSFLEPTAFVAKLDPNLAPMWFRQLGASGASAEAFEVAVDAAGDAWIAGGTTGALPGQTAAGSEDAFVARYDPDGNLAWVKQLGAAGARTGAQGIAVDATGNAYVTGFTFGSLGTEAGYVFVAKLDPSGNVR